jgi:hypothetical protein
VSIHAPTRPAPSSESLMSYSGAMVSGLFPRAHLVVANQVMDMDDDGDGERLKTFFLHFKTCCIAP